MKTEKAYFEKGNRPMNFSLLYPPGDSGEQQNSFLELSPAAGHDLGLDAIILAFTPDREHQKEIRNLFSRLPRDPEVISYRQAVLDDLLANPELAEGLTSLLPVIDSLFHYTYRSKREMSWLHEVVERTGELQSIIDCFEGMGQILGALEGRIHSEGLRNLQLRAPAAGMVNILPNFRSGSMFGGQQDFQEGDRAWPGAAILELPDLSSVHLEARLHESDRGRLQPKQDATVRIEAVPGTDFKARLDSISVLAKVDFSSGWPPAKNFDLNLAFLDVDARMRPGMTAVARIATERVRGGSAQEGKPSLPKPAH